MKQKKTIVKMQWVRLYGAFHAGGVGGGGGTVRWSLSCCVLSSQVGSDPTRIPLPRIDPLGINVHFWGGNVSVLGDLRILLWLMRFPPWLD